MTNRADLCTHPVLNRTVESVRARVQDYLDRMAALGKRPDQVTLFAHDYDACLGAINRHQSRGVPKDQPKPPPIDSLHWRGVPVARGRGKA